MITVTVNGIDLFTLSDIQCKVMQNVVSSDIFEDDMKRRLQWILTHAYDEWFKLLKEEWDPKLIANGVTMVPTDPDAYAQLVFSQPNYQDRKARDAASI